ncbi:MAG: hypothetical protein VXY09_02330 [Bacteroidota bacterium]|nr:hypothetical protein [Bacteroidota bacterium]
MKNLLVFLLLFSCSQVGNDRELSVKNANSESISFIIDLKVNTDSKENLDIFIQEITNNVLNTEEFCLEYGYYISEDRSSVTLYEKYIDSESGIKHGQNFISGPFFDRFFDLFTLQNFIVTGPASNEFKKFTSDNGFVIEYRESVDGFTR